MTQIVLLSILSPLALVGLFTTVRAVGIALYRIRYGEWPLSPTDLDRESVENKHTLLEEQYQEIKVKYDKLVIEHDALVRKLLEGVLS